MKKIFSVLLLISFSISLFATTNFVINKGHFSPIVSIQYDEKRNLIFSAEERGAISIWNKSDETLRNHFQLTSNTIDKILISPSDSFITVLSHDVDKYYLSVWNWNTERKIFSRIIEEQPLFLEYSTTGRYLFYGNVQNPSLTFLNARTGVQLNYMKQLPSIYNFGYLGSTERTLMTYSSAGSIRFYDFRTSEEKLRVNTISGLDNISVLQTLSKAYITATEGDSVYLISRQRGTTADSLDFHELKGFYQNPENGHTLTIERSNRNYLLKKWSTDGNRFSEIEKAISLPSNMNITSLVEAGGLTLAGDSEGSIYKANWETSQLESFSVDSTKKISDISISGDVLTLTGEDRLLSIRAPFFNNNLSTFSNPEFLKQENPITGETGILQLENNRLLLWTASKSPASIAILNTESNTTEYEYSDFTSPIQDITYENRKIITLEKNGTIKIIDIEKDDEIFSYTAIGLHDISMVDDTTLFAGRSSTGGKSPAITININTKETLTVHDDRFLIFDSMAVETNNQFYSLGLLNEDDKTKTILKSHNYSNLNETTPILIYNGEDINAQVLIDPKDSRTIYAKLGTSGIYKITGRNVTKYTNNKPVKKIYLDGSVLYSLNEDNSITMFKASTGRLLYTIHIFKDDAWALIPASSDMYFGSEGVEKNILSYRNNRRVAITPGNHRQ